MLRELLITESIRTDSLSQRKSFGSLAEDAAAAYLIENGLRIVMTNFTVPIGRNSRGVQRTGEIDIIAIDGDTLCFIEVKARRSVDYAPATANIDRRKQRQIIRAARAYRRLFNIRGTHYRYDALTVVWPKHSQPVIEYKKEFWNERVFAKKRWHDGLYDATF
jgi:putative endonuclease